MRASLALSALLSLSSFAQRPAPAKSFLIVDVHSSPFTSNPFMHGNSIQGDRYFLMQASMLDLVATAYGVDPSNVQGGPTWLERDRFDIRAKVPPKTTPDDIKLMLRAFLTDRFHLVVKNGTAPLPAYVLTANPGKPNMSESEGDGEGSCVPLASPPNQPAGAPSYITLSCKDMTMPALADADKVQLPSGNDPANTSDPNGALSVFDAVSRQLGLKLEKTKRPYPVLVIDHIEENPTAN